MVRPRSARPLASFGAIFNTAVEDLYAVYWRRDIDGLQFGFRCRVTGGALVPDGREILDVCYFPPEALPRPITNGTIARVHDARRPGPVVVKVFDRSEYLR